MNDNDRPTSDDACALSDALRWQLRAQRRDVAPGNDLWPGIAAQLESSSQPVSRRTPWFAVAASVLVMVGVTSLVRPPRAGDDAPAKAEARQLAQEYAAALRKMPDARRVDELKPALGELDRTARDIRKALDRDPDSRLLLDQLRRTYTLRLALSQRAAMS